MDAAEVSHCQSLLDAVHLTRQFLIVASLAPRPEHRRMMNLMLVVGEEAFSGVLLTADNITDVHRLCKASGGNAKQQSRSHDQ